MYWFVFLYVAARVYTLNDGNFVYSFDDGYIHMGIAKNLSQYGIWGVNNYETSLASSSPLWTLIIAIIFYVSGNHELLPLLLTFSTGGVLIFTIYVISKKFLNNKLLLSSLILTCFASSNFILLLYSGMEHLAFTFLAVLFLYLLIKLHYNEKTKHTLIFLFAISMIITGIRYEGFILIAAGSFYMFFNKKNFIYGLLLLIAGFFIPIIFGIYLNQDFTIYTPARALVQNIQLKSYNYLSSEILFPNGPFFENIHLYKTHVFVIIFLIISFIFLILRMFNKRIISFENILFTVSLVLFIFIQVATSFLLYPRYLSHIYIMGYIMIFIFINTMYDRYKSKFKLKKRLLFLKLLFFVFIFIYNVSNLYVDINKTLRSTKNVYEQQYQTAHFLKQFYENETVILNDIGAVSYFTNIDIIDIAPLSHNGILNYFVQNSGFDSNFKHYLNGFNPKIAIIYDDWFLKNDDELRDLGNYFTPEDRIEKWIILNNYICGDSAVTFYSLSEEKDNLIKNLEKYSDILPRTVRRESFYPNKSK